MELNWGAIGVAALSNFVIGGLWYSPALFGSAWMRANGFSAEQLKKGSPAAIFGLAFVFCLLMAATAGAQTKTNDKANKAKAAADNYDELLQQYLAEARAEAAAASAPGSLWMASLSSDLRARRLNDLVTIRVVENVTGAEVTSVGIRGRVGELVLLDSEIVKIIVASTAAFNALRRTMCAAVRRLAITGSAASAAPTTASTRSTAAAFLAFRRRNRLVAEAHASYGWRAARRHREARLQQRH